MKVMILTGGAGTRLWPLSSKIKPKQFLRIEGNYSLLQSTILRSLEITEKENIYIVTNETLFDQVAMEAAAFAIAKENVIVEPCPKNTAPALAYGFKAILSNDPSSRNNPFLICPSDHWIEKKPEIWKKKMSLAADMAMKGSMVTFGIRPTQPETNFGYIRFVEENEDHGAHRIIEFKEKPDFETAKKYLRSQDYYWNSGIFCVTPETFFNELNKYNSALGKVFDLPSMEQVKEAFATLQRISIDHAILEKTARGITIPFELDWHDLGSWESLYKHLPKDKSGNVAIGKIFTEDTRGSLLYATNKPLIALGIDELIVIEGQDAILVTKRPASQGHLNKIFEQYFKETSENGMMLNTSFRPWGYYTILEKSRGFQVKKICVYPQKRTSLQYHKRRDEHWTIVRGLARIVKGEETLSLNVNEPLFIPKETIHRIENPGTELLELIEVQYGDYLEEDDIVRIEDDFGREKIPLQE